MQSEILRFSYDPLSRLIEEVGPHLQRQYHYDKVGNSA